MPRSIYMPNSLASETSQYLLQHRDNPVEWYGWGEEPFERARAEDKPVLLSIGYSACHWCHVMAHESFEDEETARLMNERFVNVKVDREERPDVDSLYMGAVQRMIGHGGWPLTLFLTPGGAPFYGGTYFPPEPRQGAPSFGQILTAASQAYQERRQEVDGSARELLEEMKRATALAAASESSGEAVLAGALARLASSFDARNGGFGGAPKFPQPVVLDFLLRYGHRTGNQEALGMVDRTLRAMAGGGIRDQLGGGFHRYAVDARWTVPHFEKMLYDNAQLAQLYLHAHLATKEPLFRRVAEDTLAYLRREMLSPEGGFFASEDADSEGEEGKFYLWTPEEIDQLLGAEEGQLVRRHYGVTSGGHLEGRSVLHLSAPAAEARELLARSREKLFEARSRRQRPGRDEKVISAWNGMALTAFARAARALGDAAQLETARRNASFLLTSLRAEGGGLYRIYAGGGAKVPGFLEDYALVADGLHALYQADFDRGWLREARVLADQMIERFWCEPEGVFYDAGEETYLALRPRDLSDNATPSGTSAAVMTLLRLGSLLDQERYLSVARRALEGAAGLAERAPLGFGALLSALDQSLAPAREVAVVGEPDDRRTRALLDVLAERYLPQSVTAFAAPDEVAEAAREIPLLGERSTVDGKPAAYVCEHFSCREPVTGPERLAVELEGTPV
ncbi:MAG: thioredoxin domain-containing protein [Longimicrobiaceae bacterium]